MPNDRIAGSHRPTPMPVDRLTASASHFPQEFRMDPIVNQDMHEHDSSALTMNPKPLWNALQLASWAKDQVRKIQSLKPGEPLEGEAHDWLVLKIAQIVQDHGTEAVGRAIDHCLENSRFRPDISEIRAALGITEAQREKQTAARSQVSAAEEWNRLVDHLKRKHCSDRDIHGNWTLLTQRNRNKRDSNGHFVFGIDAKGNRVVLTEPVPIPSLPAQTLWCMEQIGGIARVMETPEEYIEIVRKEFLKAWPLYVEHGPQALTDGEEDIRTLLASASLRSV